MTKEYVLVIEGWAPRGCPVGAPWVPHPSIRHRHRHRRPYRFHGCLLHCCSRPCVHCCWGSDQVRHSAVPQQVSAASKQQQQVTKLTQKFSELCKAEFFLKITVISTVQDGKFFDL